MPVKRRSPEPRNRLLGYFVALAAILLAAAYVYPVFFMYDRSDIAENLLIILDNSAYIALAAPIVLISAFIIGTGFWIGWTILTIKVVPPMPDIVEKKDYSKIKAVFLCLFTLSLAAAMGYGIYIRSYWALAIPSAVIAFVILGAIFWVGTAIISARSTLPGEKK